jgi:anti-sigma regulatory factor (Ser/Thr protein kinase)
MSSSRARQSSGPSATLTITNQAEELARTASWLEAVAERFQLPERTVFKLDLVLNEALPNIISYAYQDQQSHDIVILIEDAHDHVVLEIIDDGTAFDPFAKDPFVQPESLESAAIDGRGIHLINTFTDTQEYQRIDETNVMRVCILKAPEASQRSSKIPV